MLLLPLTIAVLLSLTRLTDPADLLLLCNIHTCTHSRTVQVNYQQTGCTGWKTSKRWLCQQWMAASGSWLQTTWGKNGRGGGGDSQGIPPKAVPFLFPDPTIVCMGMSLHGYESVRPLGIQQLLYYLWPKQHHCNLKVNILMCYHGNKEIFRN